MTGRRHEVTVEVVAALVAEQLPQWADLAIRPVELGGWDNTTFRLGDDLVIRLPAHATAVAQVHKEHRWLPVLAGSPLPVPIPTPVVSGAPGRVFPRPCPSTAGSTASRWLRRR